MPAGFSPHVWTDMKSQFLKPFGDLSLSLSASKTVLVPVWVQDQHSDCPCTAWFYFSYLSACTLPRAEVTWKIHCAAVTPLAAAPVIIFTAMLRSAQAVRSHQEGTSCSVFYLWHEKVVNAHKRSIRRRWQAQPVFPTNELFKKLPKWKFWRQTSSCSIMKPQFGGFFGKWMYIVTAWCSNRVKKPFALLLLQKFCSLQSISATKEVLLQRRKFVWLVYI